MKQTELTWQLGQKLLNNGATFAGLMDYFEVNERKLYNMGIRKGDVDKAMKRIAAIDRQMADLAAERERLESLVDSDQQGLIERLMKERKEQ